MKYWFDAADRISAVDDGWLVFACENGADSLVPEGVCGQHLSTFISDDTTLQLWTSLLKRSRDGHPIEIPIRCDAPARRRTLSLSVSTKSATTCVHSRLVSEEARAPILLLDPGRRANHELLSSCSWCNRFRLAPDLWVEVEELLRTLGLFHQPVLPAISHSICPSCFGMVSAKFTS